MAMVAVVLSRRWLAAWVVVVLLLLMIVQAVVFGYAERPTLPYWIVAMLLHATVTVTLAGLGTKVWPRLLPILNGKVVRAGVVPSLV